MRTSVVSLQFVLILGLNCQCLVVAQPEELLPLPGQEQASEEKLPSKPGSRSSEWRNDSHGLDSESAAWHKESNSQRVELRFGGSLCPTCLVYFEKKLYDVDGVLSVDMAITKKRPGQLAKLATATVDYDPAKVSKEELIEMVKRNDFQFIEAKDRSGK